MSPDIAVPNIDVQAYLAANPDLAANYNSGGSLRGAGATLEDAALAHYRNTGQYEIAQGARNPLAVTNAGTAAAQPQAQGVSASPYAVQAPQTAASGASPMALAQQVAAQVNAQKPQTAATGATPPVSDFDVKAYIAANPDLAANFNSGGSLRSAGATLEEAAQRHYENTGKAEIAKGLRSAGGTNASYAVQPPGAVATGGTQYMKDGRMYSSDPTQQALADRMGSQAGGGMMWITDPNGDIRLVNSAPGSEYTDSMGNRYKVGSNQVQTAYGVFDADKVAANVSANTGKVNLLDPNYKVASDAEIAKNPDLKPMAVKGMDPALLKPALQTASTLGIDPGTAAKAVTKYQVPEGVNFVEPQLMPAGNGYGSEYYAAYTNDNDFAGAVYAQPGQKIRMVDAKSGEVVFEGEGPDAARIAAGIANTVSSDKGRKASWEIQVDQGGSWSTSAKERYDPKKTGFLGALADIALPIIASILMPGSGLLLAAAGAAGGSALSSIAQGRSLKETVMRAALSGVGSYAGGALLGNVGGGAGNAVSGGTGAAVSGGAGAAGGGALGSAGGSAGGSFLGTVGGQQVFNEMILQAAAGGLGGGVGSSLGALGGSVAGSGFSNSLQGGAGNDNLSVNNAPGASNETMTPDTLMAELQARGANVGEIVVTPVKRAALGQLIASGVTGQALAQGALDILQGVGEVTVNGTQPVQAQNNQVGAAAGATVGALVPNPTYPVQGNGILDKLKDNPLAVASLLAALGGGAGGSGGSGGVPAGMENIGKKSSLSDTFTKTLPAAGAMYANRTPRDVSMSTPEWKRYGMGSERSFWSDVPIRPGGVTDYSVMQDFNGDGVIDQADLAVFLENQQ